MKVIKHIIILSALFLLLMPACSPSKNNETKANEKRFVQVNKALYDTIIHQDSILFSAFNTRDFERFKLFFDTSLELYQDNTGLRNYDESMKAFKELFSKEYILTRKIIKESSEVYPVKDFGAIQTGQHTFCHRENGKSDCGTFKFVHIWRKQNGHWKISRVITYDH